MNIRQSVILPLARLLNRNQGDVANIPEVMIPTFDALSLIMRPHSRYIPYTEFTPIVGENLLMTIPPNEWWFLGSFTLYTDGGGTLCTYLTAQLPDGSTAILMENIPTGTGTPSYGSSNNAITSFPPGTKFYATLGALKAVAPWISPTFNGGIIKGVSI